MHYTFRKVVLFFLEYTLACFLHSQLIVQKVGIDMSCHVSHRSVSSTGQLVTQLQGLRAFANSL